MTVDVTRPDTDLAKGHPHLQYRLPALRAHLATLGCQTQLIEVFRPNLRQAYLYGAGRTPAQLQAVGLDPALARPHEPVVTNAWSSALSAHGHTLEDGTPAACAADLVPLGEDAKPWTADDPWEEFVIVIETVQNRFGLKHFHKPGKPVWDKPHIQLVEYSDARHALMTVAA